MGYAEMIHERCLDREAELRLALWAIREIVLRHGDELPAAVRADILSEAAVAGQRPAAIERTWATTEELNEVTA